MMRTDRILGAVLAVVALAFIASAYNLPAGSPFDKLGPKAFPIVVGIGLFVCSLSMILSPDKEPHWPARKDFIALLIATVVLIGYAYSLTPLGFLLPTAVAVSILSYQISPNRLMAVVTGSSVAIGLFIIFKFALGLGLKAFPQVLF